MPSLPSVEGKGIGRSCKLSLVMAGVTAMLKEDANHCGLGKGVENFNIERITRRIS